MAGLQAPLLFAALHLYHLPALPRLGGGLGEALRGHAVFDRRAKRPPALQALEEVREREPVVAALEHALAAVSHLSGMCYHCAYGA
jgi:hypothetical protein